MSWVLSTQTKIASHRKAMAPTILVMKHLFQAIAVAAPGPISTAPNLGGCKQHLRLIQWEELGSIFQCTTTCAYNHSILRRLELTILPGQMHKTRTTTSVDWTWRPPPSFSRTVSRTPGNTPPCSSLREIWCLCSSIVLIVHTVSTCTPPHRKILLLSRRRATLRSTTSHSGCRTIGFLRTKRPIWLPLNWVKQRRSLSVYDDLSIYLGR